MKLLFIIHSLKIGGTERQLVELIKGLNHNLYKVHLIFLDYASEGYTDLLSVEGIEIRYFLRSFKFDFRPILYIYRFILEKHIDLVHTFENLGSLFGLLPAKLSGRPLVCSALRSATDHNFKAKISKKIFAQFADILVSNSQAGLKNRFKRLRPHYRVVYNGVEFTRFQHEKINLLNIKSELRVNNFKHIIGMVASLSEFKDHETLLNAAPIVLNTFPEACFLLVGDGPERPKLVEKVKEMGLDKNVLFLGYRKDVDIIYQILDVFVLLTNSDVILEGISNAIIEAMAVGVPVVASRGGGTEEIVDDNVNGLLVLPKDPGQVAGAINSLLANKDRSDRIAETAKIFVRKTFHLERYVKEYKTIYRNLVSD